MSQRDTNIERFLEALGATPGLWLSLDIRSIGVHVGDAWHNALSHVRVDSRACADVPRIHHAPTTKPIAVWQEIRPFNQLVATLTDILGGRHKVDGHEIQFVELPTATEPKPAPYSDARVQLETRINAVSAVHRPQSYIAHVLELRSGRTSGPPALQLPGGEPALWKILQSNEHPFEGIAGLARVALESATDPIYQGRALVEVVAPLGVSLDRTRTSFDQGVVRVAVWAASAAAAEQCSIGYIAEGGDRSYENGTVRVTEWEGESEKHGVATLLLSRAYQRVTLLLRVGPNVVERETKTDESRQTANLHLAMHQALDPELGALRKAFEASDLGTEKKRNDDAAQLEHAVARLFSIAGFHADALARARNLPQVFDVLACSPDGKTILAIECTLGQLNSGKGKPGRLIGRVHTLRATPTLAGVEVLPLMVTTRNRGAVQPSEMAAAAQDGVGVLFREDLFELLSMVERGGLSGDVLARCRNSVPSVTAHGGDVIWPRSQ